MQQPNVPEMVDLFWLDPLAVILLIFNCASAVAFIQNYSNKYVQFSTQEIKSDSQIHTACICISF